MQKIKGNHNLIAGRDLINEGDGFRPDPNNPKLMQCECGWPGLNRTADKCPKCGNNYLRDRLEAEEQRQRQAIEENNRFWQKIAFFCLVLFIGTTQISSRTSLSAAESFVLTLAVFWASWFGLVWISVYVSLWWDEQKRK